MRSTQTLGSNTTKQAQLVDPPGLLLNRHEQRVGEKRPISTTHWLQSCCAMTLRHARVQKQQYMARGQKPNKRLHCMQAASKHKLSLRSMRTRKGSTDGYTNSAHARADTSMLHAEGIALKEGLVSKTTTSQPKPHAAMAAGCAAC